MNFKQVIDKYGYPLFSKEVSDTVDKAKKYLTRYNAERSLDRQTDRQTDRHSECLCNGRHARNRSENQQKQPGVSDVEEGCYP